MAILADKFELVTDPDTGAPAIKVTYTASGRIQVSSRQWITSLWVQEVYTDYRRTELVEGLSNIVLELGETAQRFNVASADVNEIIAYLFGISEHFYTAMRIIEVPDGQNQYAFISTNRDTRVVSKTEVAGWEFKDTTTDGIHNLCVTLKTGHTILVVLGLLEYKAWESAHLGRFNYRYINYDGTVTDNPVFPPEPPADEGDGATDGSST